MKPHDLKNLQFDPYFDRTHPKYIDRTINALAVVLLAAVVLSVVRWNVAWFLLGVAVDAVVFFVAQARYGAIRRRYVGGNNCNQLK